MTTPDRTEDLVQRMLERRAGAPPPGWLLPGVAQAVRATPQTRGARSRPGWLAGGRGGRLALVAAAALLLLALAAGALVAGGIFRRGPAPTLPAIVVVPSPGESPSAEAPSSPVPTDALQPTPAAPSPTLAKDTIAVVTTAGDGLRVRSAPDVGGASKKLTPLLGTGDRMLVVRGPVSADGYQWYEVQPQDGPFGWVAAGKGDEDWIEPAAPRCTDDLDEAAVWTVRPIDFLVCYGDTPVNVRVAYPASGDTDDVGHEAPACPYIGSDVTCTARPAWMFNVRNFAFASRQAHSDSFGAATHGSVADRLDHVPPVDAMTLTVAMDAPEARDCRIVDRRGRDLISRDEAITRCRLTFVVRDVAWDAADRLLEPDTLARVVATDLHVHESPAGRDLGSLTAGEEVFIADEPQDVDGVRWYPVFPSDRAGRAFGWVPFIGPSGEPTLEVSSPRCPSLRNWRGVVALSPAARLTCFDSREVALNLRVERTDPPPGDGGACDTYRSSAPLPHPCTPRPAWLATASGVTGADPRDPGPGIDLRIDPTQVQRDWFPTTPTLMRVTGSFSNDAAYHCEMFEAGADHPPLADLETETYCREQFVVTALGSPAP